MAKKDFGKQLKRTVEQEDKAFAERFDLVDKVNASGGLLKAKKPVADDVPPVPAEPIEGEPLPVDERPAFALTPSTRPAKAAQQASASAVIRDNFSMPEEDYALIDELRRAAALTGLIDTTKSSVVRAGLRALKKMSSQELADILSEVGRIKPGRRNS